MTTSFRSMLFVPGNSPALLQTSAFLGADAVILDLEDAVALGEKDAARRLVSKSLTNLSYAPAAVVVRVNGLDTRFGRPDIVSLLPHSIHSILLPKATPDFIRTADELLAGTEIGIIALLESALGVEKAYEIATLSPRMRALFFGAEDYTADMGISRTVDGQEIAFARARVALAGKAANIETIDTPFTDINDMEAFARDVSAGKALGFTGKALISPRHIAPLHELLKPRHEDVVYARRVLAAARKELESGVGVFNLDGKMIDAPIIIRAERIIELARRYGGEPDA